MSYWINGNGNGQEDGRVQGGDGPHFDRFDQFEDMGLRPELLLGLKANQLEYPSYIQERAIVPITRGRDMIIQGKSGTGKTDAVIIGVLQRVNTSVNELQAIIIEPTRELAEQTTKAVERLGQFMYIKCGTFIGGRRLYNDLQTIDWGIQVAVTTVGRLMDHLEQERLDTNHVKVLVLDEFDQLLEKKGQRKQIDSIIRGIKAYGIQLVLVSATTTDHILTAADNKLIDPIRILLRNKDLSLSWIKQYFVRANTREAKLKKLLDYFCGNDVGGQTIIFCNRKLTVDWLIGRLESRNYKLQFIHADMSQWKREAVMKDFLENKTKILITSDLLSRGIDIHQISTVINFDFPRLRWLFLYIHRIARSGRYGERGTAITFVDQSDMDNIGRVERLYDIKMEERVIDNCMPSTNWINLFLAAIICATRKSMVDWTQISQLMESRIFMQTPINAKRCEDIFCRLIGLYKDVLERANTFQEAEQWFVYFNIIREMDLNRTGLNHKLVADIDDLYRQLVINDCLMNQN